MGPKHPLHSFVFVIPMHNEAHFIAKKIANLDALQYPKDNYSVLIIDDGSTDDSLQCAKKAKEMYPQLRISIQSFPSNRGKVAVINAVIPTLAEDCIVFLSDVSSTFTDNVLERANRFFNQPRVGVFCPTYRLKRQTLEGEKDYWAYQSAIKRKEALLGSPIGYHGSGYAIKKSAWQTIPNNTINDDFVIPLQVIAKGNLGIYDSQSRALENEITNEHHDWHRRIRIGAGNIQQVRLLWRLLLPRNGWVAWMFFSSKVLRVAMPWLLIVVWLSNAYLAKTDNALFLYSWWAQNIFYGCALVNVFIKTKITELISYFVIGHCALLLGFFYALQHSKKIQWKRSNTIRKKRYIHPIVFIGKWLTDKVSGLIGSILFLLLLPIIGLAIKVSSPGPILYRQLRVGITTDKQTKFFFLYKFRSMRPNAKTQKTLWTQANDPRIYALGNFLRKTHLDELPQFLNILKGDMSLIGPRPERPSLFPFITKNIPLYEERLYWVKPGLTGLAQITYRYDETIEDVRKKVAYDNAYATYLTKPLVWFKADLKILIKTVTLVLMGKGF